MAYKATLLYKFKADSLRRAYESAISLLVK